MWLGPQLVFVMTDPKDVEVVLTSMKLITKSDEYEFIKPWLNTGLLTSTEKKWISRRKIITPAFHFKILEDFVETFDRQTTILVEKLKIFEGRGEFNIFPLTALCALDVICGNLNQFNIKKQKQSYSTLLLKSRKRNGNFVELTKQSRLGIRKER